MSTGELEPVNLTFNRVQVSFTTLAEMKQLDSFRHALGEGLQEHFIVSLIRSDGRLIAWFTDCRKILCFTKYSKCRYRRPCRSPPAAPSRRFARSFAILLLSPCCVLLTLSQRLMLSPSSEKSKARARHLGQVRGMRTRGPLIDDEL